MSLARRLFLPTPRQAVTRAPEQISQNLRAPQIASNYTTGYHQLGGKMIPEWDAESAVYQAYLANVFVYACVNIIANTISSLPFRAGKNPDRPLDYDVDAPLARLLGPPPGAPNPDIGPSELWAHAIAQYIVTGRFAWELEWKGKPAKSELVAIWPLISQYLDANPPAAGEQAPHFFTSFSYRANGEEKSFSREEVYYDWKPSQHSIHQPESALQAARLNISGAVMQDVYDYAFLKNDARPAAIVITEQWETPEMKEAFEAKYNAKYGGASNAGKALFAEVASSEAGTPVGQMIDIKNLGLSQKDSDAVNRYSSNIKAIVAGLGVPMSKLDASERTFSNAAEEDKSWWTSRLLPLLTKLQQSINVRLAPMLGEEVGWFDLSGVEVLKKQKNYTQVSPLEVYDIDGITKNELREAVGEEAIEGGDKFKSEYAPTTSEPEVSVDGGQDQQVSEDEKTKAVAIEQDDPEPSDNIIPISKSGGKKAAAGPGPKELDQPGETKRSLPVPGVSRHTPVVSPAEPNRANPGNSQGVMVAFWLTPEQSRELTIPGFEPPEQLHLTLAYLGKISDDIDRQALQDAVASFADTHGPILGTISGKGQFTTPDGIAVVALVDAPGLGAFRVALVEALGLVGIETRSEHDFTAHITLAYVPTQGEADQLKVPSGISVGWQKIAVSWGNESTFYELGTKAERERLEAERSEQWRNLDSQVAIFEGPWITAMDVLFARQEETVISRLEGKRGRQFLKRANEEDEDPADPSVNLIFDEQHWRSTTVETVKSLYESIVAYAGSRLIERFGVMFNIKAPFIQQFINERSSFLAKEITETTYEQIKNALSAGVALGEGIVALIKRVRAVFKAARENRSTIIARTETLAAYNASTVRIGSDYGTDIVGGKEWVSARDSRVRESHKIADRQKRSITEDFLVGGYSMEAPLDARAPAKEVIQCRCHVSLIDAATWQEETSRALKARQWRAVEEVEEQLIRIALERANA